MRAVLPAVLRCNPQFRTLWLAQVVSEAGDWLNRVALLVLLERLSRADRSLGIGLLYGLEFALRLSPYVVLSSIAGSLADRLPRRTLMIAADWLRAVLVCGFLLVDQPADLPLFYSLLLALMGVSIFFEAARAAILPNTVRRQDLPAAYALSAATWSVLLSLGAVIGGVLAAFIGVKGVFLCNALSYLLSSLLLFRLRAPVQERVKEPFRWREALLYAEVVRGWRHARAKGVAVALTAKSFWGPAGGFLVLLPIAAATRYSSVEAGLAVGLLYAARGLGTGVGPVLARRIFGDDDRALRRQIGGGFFVAVAAYGLFPWCSSLLLALACVFIAHSGGSSVWVSSTLLWQHQIDDVYRGRVFAAESLGATAVFSVGGLLAGAIYDGTRNFDLAVWVVAGLVLVGGACWNLLARAGSRAPVRAAIRSAESGVPE